MKFEPTDFVSVRVSTLRAGKTLQFDLFVEFKDVKLLYRPRDSVFEAGTLEKFKKKKIKKAYIPASQESEYLGYLDSAMESLAQGTDSVESRGELAKDALRQEADSIEKTLESEASFKRSENRIQHVVDFMLSEPKALAAMLSQEGLSVDSSSHGSNVSSLALGLGVHTKFVGREELNDLAVASLLHDSGLQKLGFELGDNLESLPKEKRADYKRHPEVAVELVAGKKFITPRVLRLVQDHEEYGDGLGFPEKKRLAKMSVDSQIFNLCDAFDHFCIRCGKAGKAAVPDFIEKNSGHFDLQLLEALETLLR